jgi:hypothetical protein
VLGALASGAVYLRASTADARRMTRLAIAGASEPI